MKTGKILPRQHMRDTRRIIVSGEHMQAETLTIDQFLANFKNACWEEINSTVSVFVFRSSDVIVTFLQIFFTDTQNQCPRSNKEENRSSLRVLLPLPCCCLLLLLFVHLMPLL